MTQQIHLGAILERGGRLLLTRTQIGAPWELPGGPFTADDEDMDATMSVLMGRFGVESNGIEADFFETVFLGTAEERLVFNIYTPTVWSGEPTAPDGMGLGWFEPGALAGLDMDARIRDIVLQAFGLKERPNSDASIMEAIREALPAPKDDAPAAPLTTPPTPTPLGTAISSESASTDSRIERGRDVLRTLNAGDADAEANLRRRVPELTDDILGVLGDTWANSVIDRKTRSLQVVAMLAALGKTGPLRTHIAGALNHGATVEQVVETMRTVAVYAGFPAALEAWSVMEEVFAARGVARPGAQS